MMRITRLRIGRSNAINWRHSGRSQGMHVLSVLVAFSSLRDAQSLSVIKGVHRNLLSGTIPSSTRHCRALSGWVQRSTGEWTWEDDEAVSVVIEEEPADPSSATPKLPSGTLRPKQSLGQNFLKDGNTVAKIVKAFESDVAQKSHVIPVELGPGAGALTKPLYAKFGSSLRCVEIDRRCVALLRERYPDLKIMEMDVLQMDYVAASAKEGAPLSVIGNLPYYITSQILFALADAAHRGAISSATVTMQLEVAERIIANTSTKAYGILSVVFQIYSHPCIHFKIPKTVFYPEPKVTSALIGLQFLSPDELRTRLAGVSPTHLRKVMNTAFQQRRKTIRNSLKKLLISNDKKHLYVEHRTAPHMPELLLRHPDVFDTEQRTLPEDWTMKRPEELNPLQFIELTRALYGPEEVSFESIRDMEINKKIWRKLRHGPN